MCVAGGEGGGTDLQTPSRMHVRRRCLWGAREAWSMEPLNHSGSSGMIVQMWEPLSGFNNMRFNKKVLEQEII